MANKDEMKDNLTAETQDLSDLNNLSNLDDNSNELEDSDAVLDDEDDIDDESNEKLDKIMKYIGIGIAAIILIITVFVIVKLVSSGASHKEKQTETEATTEESDLAEVPDVVGLSTEDAIAALKKAGFGHTIMKQSSDTVEAGKVISQGTAAGSKVSTDKVSVLITVSTGPENKAVTIPSVKNYTEDKAKATLEDAGFKVNVKYEYSSSIKNGYVISYDPTGSANEGTTINVVVSLGEETQAPTTTEKETETTTADYSKEKATVPNVVGQTKKAAESALKTAGFKVSDDEVNVTDKTQDGIVISQNQKAGTSLDKDSEVVITIGKYNSNN